jgi:ADP-heptose:LPS heptosyltransferase
VRLRILERLLGNEFDRLLTKAAKRGASSVLLYWNRGLGDIALGLYGVVERIRTFVPDAQITVVTRQELAEPFQLLEIQHIRVDPELIRKGPDGPREVFARLGIRRDDFDLVLDQINPTKWLAWQHGRVTPRLRWKLEYDRLCEKFGDIGTDKLCIGAHVNSETGHYYGYVKDWPAHHWQDLFARVQAHTPVQFILFGNAADDRFKGFEGFGGFDARTVIDLRGETSFLEMLSVLKNRCNVLVAPDSGILSMAYYLDCAFPLTVVSLWADPRQGVLKHGVPSPNPRLKHYPLIGEAEDISRISVEQVFDAIRPALHDLEKTNSVRGIAK